MARSARITELNLDIARISELPSTIMPGTVDKIIPSRDEPTGKAQTAVDGADHRYRELLVEDTLSSLVLHTKGAPAQIEGTRSEMFKCSEAKRCLG